MTQISKLKQDSSRTPFGRYSQGGVTTKLNNRLGWWERNIYEKAPEDITYTVLSSEQARPDLIAFKLYQRPQLAWLVLQFNNIVDPETELTTGTVIQLPSPSRVLLTITSVPL